MQQQRPPIGGYQQQLEDARSSLPPMLENSPNPTVTDDGACTDCETCAGTDQMSCYNCIPSELHHTNNKDAHGVMSWLAQPTGMDPSHNNMILNTTSYPVGLSTPGVASLRPKTELCEGEDEAQSIPKGFDYGWEGAGALYHCNEEDNDPSSPLQSSTNLSCLTGSLCSGSENMNFTYKYRLQDVTAPVDSGLGSQEILWAY